MQFLGQERLEYLFGCYSVLFAADYPDEEIVRIPLVENSSE